ncbi:hypothetical protein Ancab_035494 [Ancistrocladus abbreviatus]
MKHRRVPFERPWIIAFSIAMFIAVVTILAINLSTTAQYTYTSFFCSPSRGKGFAAGGSTTPTQLHAILHYATSKEVPQQSRAEIRVTMDLLHTSYYESGCNMLVFGLGHDSLMWSAFNPNGLTMFLEEDPDWVQSILTRAPSLRVHAVNYQTHLYDAKNLLAHYKVEPSCLPPKLHLRGNSRCRHVTHAQLLVLSELPDEVYNKEWDVILIDGPKGYFPEAPGRMAAIYTAAVIAKFRRRPGVTHVILHDVDRRVEKAYAERFLCRKHMVTSVGRLWHFIIPPAPKEATQQRSTSFFC